MTVSWSSPSRAATSAHQAPVEIVEFGCGAARPRRFGHRHGIDLAVLAELQPEADVELAFLRKIVDAQAGQHGDPRQCRRDLVRRVAGNHEPHVEAVLAPVVVGHGRQRVDQPGDMLELQLGGRERRQRHCAAEPRRVEQRAEA
jgi:hypothetical protein